MRTIAVLGATGSIGTQALDIVEKYPNDFRAVCLAAMSNSEGLFKLARKFSPEVCALVKPAEIPEDLKHIRWFFGENSAREAVLFARPDDALCAVVGIAGLGTVLSSLDVCKRVLLANKEALVTGGSLVMRKAKEKKVELLPVDSEHSAIFQCLKAAGENAPRRIILTCSGGALRTWDRERIENASVGEVLSHPTWRMGSKITVDCASLMNKGLEVIEASYLFDMPPEKIDVVIHPQSVIHSMVEFRDGAVLAQLGKPDMRGPIGYAMAHPGRIDYGGERLDFARLDALTFEAPDGERFPCLGYARQALKTGGTAPVILNGANEEAVLWFLSGKTRFGNIAKAVYAALNECAVHPVNSEEDIYTADALARKCARKALERLGPEA